MNRETLIKVLFASGSEEADISKVMLYIAKNKMTIDNYWDIIKADSQLQLIERNLSREA